MGIASVGMHPGRAASQTDTPSLKSCGAPSKGTISGKVLEDGTDRPIPGFVQLGGAVKCMLITGQDGSFRFTDLPGGEYELRVARMGFRAPPIVRVELLRDTAEIITFRLKRENTVTDCSDEPLCADVLAARPEEIAGLSEKERTLEAVLRTGIALAGRPWESKRDWVICVSNSDSLVFRVLKTRFEDVVPASECGMGARPVTPSASGIIHVPTNRPGRIISGSVPDILGSEFETRISFTAGGLWGAGWICSFELEGRGWRPRSCRMEWIS
jgi:hypothetical protein